jgi:hypothetical protein
MIHYLNVVTLLLNISFICVPVSWTVIVVLSGLGALAVVIVIGCVCYCLRSSNKKKKKHAFGIRKAYFKVTVSSPN